MAEDIMQVSTVCSQFQLPWGYINVDEFHALNGCCGGRSALIAEVGFNCGRRYKPAADTVTQIRYY